MKTFFTILFVLVISLNMNAQEGQDMAYRFGYLFKPDKLNSSGKLYLSKEQQKNILDTIGKFSLSGNTTVITKQKSITSTLFLPKEIAVKKLKGAITERNKDTLFINFWDIKSETISLKGKTNYVNMDDNGEDFIYIINKWKTNSLFKGEFFDFPFRFNQFMATNLPFRILLDSGTLESDFLNANVSYLIVSGHTRIYKSENIKPRNRYFAYGPYLGLSSIDNTVTKKKEFGLNYGANIAIGIQGFNFTIAYGFQNGFHTDTKKIKNYIGFGIGFKLLDTFSPEIKNKE